MAAKRNSPARGQNGLRVKHLLTKNASPFLFLTGSFLIFWTRVLIKLEYWNGGRDRKIIQVAMAAEASPRRAGPQPGEE